MTNKNVLIRLDKLEKRVSDLENSLKTGTPKRVSSTSTAKKLSLRELLIAKRPTNDVKVVLTACYYLEKHEGLTSFNINDIEQALEHAKAKKPANINDKVQKNIVNGHMDEASDKKDNRKAWYLTNSGEAYVDNNFSSET